ncbi:hypothetical protein THIOM_005495 [Candidatus Thiomargarita nelsonii]|uniref:Uncharacterized protein n=1 Tax=Candidatus Thiomargarita nelsonii TaxID=1003181 RepID=A0A176RT50_9GAMM|nr:hypothetical protein THIOM_005495 [Candidatus Thiomargarita nelsonii]
MNGIINSIRNGHEITSRFYNHKSQNKTCQVKTKPGRSKAQPELAKDFDLAGFVFNLPGLVLTFI